MGFPSTFYNIIFNNDPLTEGDVTLATNNYIVNNQLTMTRGNVNLNGLTLTLGTSRASPGILSYTAGFLYSNTGRFTRWISAPSAAMGGVASNALGHFPMGTSAGDYRPLWLTYTSNLQAGGTVSVLHDGTIGASGASHTDATWGGGTVVAAVTNSFWVLSVANGFALNGSTGTIRFGGTGYGTNTLTDLDATLSASAPGTFVAATNAITAIEVNRRGLSTDSGTFANSWRIGTKNSTQSPLPIELLSFDAKQNGHIVDLNWVTASEINNDYFTLESSTDAINFEPFANVDGAGNSTVVLNYNYVDNHPYSGISYYRLKQTDFNGKFEYSNIVTVDFLTNEYGVSIYPNPTANELTIEIPGNKELVNFEIINSIGVVVYQGNLNQKTTVQTSSFAPGVYLIKIVNAYNYEFKKLIKQ